MYPVKFNLIAVLSCLACSHVNAANIQAKVIDSHGKIVKDAIVSVMPVNKNNLPKQTELHQAVDQVDKEFTPYVNPVIVNTEVLFPNRDDIRHHVYSFSPAKNFELPLYSGDEAPPVLFDKPGVVTLGCNIHDWMIGYIYVSETPYFTKTTQSGTVTIEVPTDEYNVTVWHPDMIGSEISTMKHVNLNKSETANIEWKLTLKKPFRIPRAATGKGFGY
jgi:plastocyanin